MKLNQIDVGGEVVKSNEVYELKDNKTLNNAANEIAAERTMTFV